MFFSVNLTKEYSLPSAKSSWLGESKSRHYEPLNIYWPFHLHIWYLPLFKVQGQLWGRWVQYLTDRCWEENRKQNSPKVCSKRLEYICVSTEMLDVSGTKWKNLYRLLLQLYIMFCYHIKCLARCCVIYYHHQNYLICHGRACKKFFVRHYTLFYCLFIFCCVSEYYQWIIYYPNLLCCLNGAVAWISMIFKIVSRWFWYAFGFLFWFWMVSVENMLKISGNLTMIRTRDDSVWIHYLLQLHSVKVYSFSTWYNWVIKTEYLSCIGFLHSLELCHINYACSELNMKFIPVVIDVKRNPIKHILKQVLNGFFVRNV